MRRFYVSSNQIVDNQIIIDGEEFAHLSNVLRLKINDEIICFCGDKYEYYCKIVQINKKNALLEIIKKDICSANPKANITLFQGLPKGDKLELIIQKATELGISKIVPFENEFTIAKANNSKLDRLQKISLESCKQCGRTIPIQLETPVKFIQMIDLLKDYDYCLFAYENSTNKLNFNDIKLAKNIAIIVGSEGGFSEEEVKLLNNNNVKDVTISSRILRTETASISLCSLACFIKEV